MNMPGLRALSFLLFCVVGLSLSAQAGDAKLCVEQSAPPVLALNSGGQSNEQAATATAPSVELWFGEWRSELPPGVSLVISGGGLVNNSFPALSADGSRIAILYHAPHPMEDAYPTLDIYSTASLSLHQRIELFPQHHQSSGNPNLNDSLITSRVERRVHEVNRYLTQGGFRQIPRWFEHGGYRPQPTEPPDDKFGKRLILGTADEPDVVTVNSLVNGATELRIELPRFFVEAENPDNSCSGYGLPEEAWYSQDAGIFILRVTFNSTRDGCEQPEEWLLKHL